jgi:hypothetical protein
MSLIPSKTGIPDVVHNRLANTVDFHVASTNFTSILNSYTNLLALSKYYDKLKYEPDPITAEATFWEDMANSNIDLQKVARNPKATKYIKRVEINIPPGDSLKLDEGGNPISYINPAGNLVAETVNGEFIPLTQDDTTNVNKKINKVATGNWDDLVSVDGGEFLYWWIDKYRKAHFKVKEVLSEKITIEDSFLQEISESIGFLGYQHLYPQSRYLHYADEDSDPTPVPYNSIIDDKLEFETSSNILGLSKRTEALFKRNIQQVINIGNIATDAHGENLVTDHFHYERLKKEQPEINENISNVLGATYKALTWLTTNKLSNKQKTVPGIFELVVENSIEEVDILLNKIQILKRPFTMDILK